MAHESSGWFLFLGIFVHIFYLSSVFHIYFKSPIIPGLKKVAHATETPAKRLVLIITDGLQAEKAFHRKYEENTKFLRSVIKDKGVWGVSHTRVPTESRVGHVSLIAGTYEDVSAITNGWKDNPVDFDSVFNQSTRTWCWGSPDILRIFDKDSMHIVSHSYDASKIDFGDKDPSKLDKWVFQHVEEFFSKANKNDKLYSQLHNDKIVFFLHLLGTDTIGHVKKPDSEEYIANLALVDREIKKISNLISGFYDNDNKTSYIVTSDHGMTPWGAHGTGLQSETETPFIAWGAGVKKSSRKHNINNDLQSTVWGLEDMERYDIKQVDIAPLMSFLIGTSIPVNSVGILPYKILNISEKSKADGMLANAKQIIEQYHAHERKAQHSSFFFKTYSGFADSSVRTKLAYISDMIDQKDYSIAITKCEELITSALEGVQYYHQYNRLFLSVMVNIGFVAWILYVLMNILEYHTTVFKEKLSHSRCNNSTYVYYITLSIICFVYWFKSADLADIVYTLIPLIMCERVINGGGSRIRSIVAILKKSNLLFYFQVLCCLAGTEIIVVAFFNRGALSVISLCLSMLPWYKIVTNSSPWSIMHKISYIAWTVISLIISIFPLLPVVTREENYFLVLLAGFIASTIGVIYSLLVKSRDTSIVSLLTGMLVLSLVLKMNSVKHVQHGDGLPLVNQICSWVFLLVSPCLGFLVNSKSIIRLLAVSLSLFSVYILTAISYDALFLLVLTVQLSLWIFLEVNILSSEAGKKSWASKTIVDILSTDHLRVSFMFIYFIFLAFFGTGNIASINSFDIATTYCFKTIFNPWIQGFILGVKVLIPFLVVTYFFRSLQSLTRLPMRGLFSIILLLTDIMAINFFFMVKDEGSWLDIGQSLSHFVITLIFIVFLLPAYELSYFISGRIENENVKFHSL